MKNENKTNFRSWKSGKTWLYSASVLSLLMTAGGVVGSTVTALAETTNQSTQVQPQALSTEDQAVASGIASNVNATTTVDAKKLANASAPGPFTAGVNSVIPLEAFGGDGMLTRLLLAKGATSAWSDNGTDKNSAILPVDGLASGKYFYEVDIDGTDGATGQALLDTLRENGTKAYTATVKVYAADASTGTADTSKIITSKSININIQGLTDNINSTTNVTAGQLANAKAPGPFTAGVNQVIPYEAFGGDGMLTRLLLNSASKAPWSDNGSAKNPGLLPVDGLSSGKYFYEVDLAGTNGATGQQLLDTLRANGKKSYMATVKVYNAGTDGTADTHKVIATKTIQVNVAGLTDNINATTNVSADKLDKAKAPGPFTAGVNQTIPFEAFGGDGMLTRLLLNSASQAAWSDNGTAKNPALLPVDGLAKGNYFYEVDLAGTNGATGQKLLDTLRANGTKTYTATVKIYASNTAGTAADTSKVIATKTVKVTLNKTASKPAEKPSTTVKSQAVYRLYNKVSGEHLYTSSSYEYNQLIKQDKNWKQEGIGFKAPSSGASVYRVYNPKSGEHLYTTSSYEVKVLTSQAGWKSEGVAFHTADKTGSPVYRLYNPAAGIGAHFNTSSSYEKTQLVKAGWKFEGIAWYGVK
ncbi:SSURE domain-containing protein [Lactococcus termiticola]|uniref:DUF5648 domain-containing protein n=1 Tax=Lactococcus termiticola TaxID=2169526 RepID=A0A2R5HGD3_9LACT|nr:fibronectin-binding SSURE repeat-containing protein [Lactococcus termiticola]GBG97109.1 hypothetical protein NtB2_01246 [Lactococcus termiticola]